MVMCWGAEGRRRELREEEAEEEEEERHREKMGGGDAPRQSPLQQQLPPMFRGPHC